MVDRYTSHRTDWENSHYSRTSHYTSTNNPSFSSTLLDAVYRSIDSGEEENIVIYQETMRKKQTYISDTGANGRGGGFRSEEAMANFQRACMIDKWMEKKAVQKIGVRANSVADPQKRKSWKNRENSSSSSSDSSCGANLFSSSEAESFPVQRPKPVRTGCPAFEMGNLSKNYRDFGTNHRDRIEFADQLETKPKHETGFLKTKSRALKIYDDLKKAKQPTSPGGKLAGFLNSLFTHGNLKRHKPTSNCDDTPSLKSANTSTCSSASSFSRSCLSKTPSSAGKSSNCAKRSVRFYPVSVVVDEDGQKSLQEEVNYHYTVNNGGYKKQNSNPELASCKKSSIRDIVNEALMVRVLEKNRRVEEVARGLLRNYQKKIPVFDPELNNDDDDDDAASDASSDLFELDNLTAIGMEKYKEELPVYETTHLGTNRFIANGLML